MFYLYYSYCFGVVSENDPMPVWHGHLAALGEGVGCHGDQA